MQSKDGQEESTAELELVYDSLRLAKESLTSFANGLPNLDANCQAYYIAWQLIGRINVFLKDTPFVMQQAKALTEEFPNFEGKSRFQDDHGTCIKYVKEK